MIPIRLELTNFLSYRDTAVLDLKGIHLAGISGPNGAGKSSIMEAITWALFGQSRVRSDDDLVNRQVDEDGAAEVRFVFDLEGVRYRVIRRKRSRKTTVLELQMDAGDGAWKPLSESKLRETQAAIEDLLRMNYDTFTNASFLLQGKADQFTTRTPGQRKEILAELLGVTEWEQYREQAAAVRKQVGGQIDLLNARLDEHAAELEEEDQRRQELDEARAKHQETVEKRETREKLLHEARLKEAALEEQRYHITTMENRQKQLHATLEQARTTLQNRQERQRQLVSVVDQEETISAAYAAWQTADQQVQELQELARKHNELSRAMQPFKVTLAQEQSRLEQQKKALAARFERVQEARLERKTIAAEIAAAEKELAGLQAERDQHQESLDELNTAREELRQVAGQRDLWRQELAKIKEESKRMSTLADDKKTTATNQAEAEALISDLDERIAVIREQQQMVTQLQAELQALQAQQPTLRLEMDKLKERIGRLETAEADGTCPLCDQALSEEHRQTVLQNLRDEGKHFGDSYRENEARLKALEIELPQVRKTVDSGIPLERERQAQQKRLAAAEARLAEIARAQETWSAGGEKRLVELAAYLADDSEFKALNDRVESLQEALDNRKSLQAEVESLQGRIASERGRYTEIDRLLDDWESTGQDEQTTISRQLATEDFALDARRELTSLQEQLQDIGYNAADHQAAVQRKVDAADAPQRYQELKEARAALVHLQEPIAELEERINQQETDLVEQKTQLEEARTRLAALEAGSINLAQIQGEVNRLRDEEIAAAQQVGMAQQRLNVLDDLKTMSADLLKERESLSLRDQRLHVLEKACGRKGVQALLIEHALPEIEDGANELLERLTGGDMRIKFDTQRQLKSRDALAETLDIIISDRAGERPYDNYSGGEQFRINFAIRLALSQLLAKRAGARLQTLVIDEGFGSQDPQGRQRLIEAINTVQEDFACILVITHIDELREAFPTRIEVQKDLRGSQITVH